MRPEQRAAVRAVVAAKYEAYTATVAIRDAAAEPSARCMFACAILSTPCADCAQWYWDTHGNDAVTDAKTYAVKNPSCLLLLEVARPELAGFVADQMAEADRASRRPSSSEIGPLH